MIHLGGFMTYIGQIESIACLLGVKHQGNLIAFLHGIDHFLMLSLRILLHHFSSLLQVIVGCCQLHTKYGQGLFQILLVKHGTSLHAEHDGKGKEKKSLHKD